MVAAPAMRQVRHPRDRFATDFTDREVWSLALRRRDAYGVAGRSGLRADGGGPPRADGLPEPHTLLQEEGFELLHDPMIERVCPLHSVLALSRRYSLGRRAPTSDSSGRNSSVGEAKSPSSAAIIATTAIHLSLRWSERGARAPTVSEWSRARIVSRVRCWAR